jgi:hypothetical protein
MPIRPTPLKRKTAMRLLVLNAMFFIAASSLSTGAIAQNIHKCGDTYNQLPCPGGRVVNATDSRTREQKSQADLATARDARNASAMESERLQQEKIDLANNTPQVKPASADTTSKGLAKPGQKKLKKRKVPDYFSAQEPREKKKKQPLKKVGSKKETGNT